MRARHRTKCCSPLDSVSGQYPSQLEQAVANARLGGPERNAFELAELPRSTASEGRNDHSTSLRQRKIDQGVAHALRSHSGEGSIGRAGLLFSQVCEEQFEWLGRSNPRGSLSVERQVTSDGQEPACG